VKILLDHCVPRSLRSWLTGHDVHTAYERGWATLKNGAHLTAGESEGFEILVTTDQNLPYQQSLSGRAIAVVILAGKTNRVADLSTLMAMAIKQLAIVRPGAVITIGPDSLDSHA
jgi:predicted nuclease of predicted toxin-antitoxin system